MSQAHAAGGARDPEGQEAEAEGSGLQAGLRAPEPRSGCADWRRWPGPQACERLGPFHVPSPRTAVARCQPQRLRVLGLHERIYNCGSAFPLACRSPARTAAAPCAARPQRPAPFAGTRRRPLPVARAARSRMRGTRTPAPVPASPGRCSVHASVWGLSCDELHTTCCPSWATCLESRSAPERPPCPATSCCSVLPRPLAAAGVRPRLGIPRGPWGQALRLVRLRLPAPRPRVP